MNIVYGMSRGTVVPEAQSIPDVPLALRHSVDGDVRVYVVSISLQLRPSRLIDLVQQDLCWRL